jgi:hypothetical protein
MINREKRDAAWRLLENFWLGKIDTDKLEDNYPTDRRDPALISIYEQLWPLWDSYHAHTFNKKEQCTEDSNLLFRRCIAFLQTDLEYEWPLLGFDRVSLKSIFFNFMGLRKKANSVVEDRLSKFGGKETFHQIWPFRSQEDLTKHT